MTVNLNNLPSDILYIVASRGSENAIARVTKDLNKIIGPELAKVKPLFDQFLKLQNLYIYKKSEFNFTTSLSYQFGATFSDNKLRLNKGFTYSTDDFALSVTTGEAKKQLLLEDNGYLAYYARKNLLVNLNLIHRHEEPIEEISVRGYNKLDVEKQLVLNRAVQFANMHFGKLKTEEVVQPSASYFSYLWK